MRNLSKLVCLAMGAGAGSAWADTPHGTKASGGFVKTECQGSEELARRVKSMGLNQKVQDELCASDISLSVMRSTEFAQRNLPSCKMLSEKLKRSGGGALVKKALLCVAYAEAAQFDTKTVATGTMRGDTTHGLMQLNRAFHQDRCKWVKKVYTAKGYGSKFSKDCLADPTLNIATGASLYCSFRLAFGFGSLLRGQFASIHNPDSNKYHDCMGKLDPRSSYKGGKLYGKVPSLEPDRTEYNKLLKRRKK
jgi:hypothetical protein